MKKIALLFTCMLIGLTTVSAKELNNNNNIDKNHFRNAEPITFIENGVKFLVFADGSFDYNTINRNNQYANKHNVKRNNKRVIVSRDRFGKINRIGNVFLNYNRFGKITSIGSVNIDYNRKNGIVNRVGYLNVDYNQKGKIKSSKGHVKRNNSKRR